MQDSGTGMSNEQLDALFRDLEQVSTDGEGFFESDEPGHSLTDGKETRALGLGLAMVARIVRNSKYYPSSRLSINKNNKSR